jgi:hypothetical protein
MKTTRYNEQELTERLFRRGVPTLAWALGFAFFAFSGLVSRDEPTQIADVPPAPRPTANETGGVPVAAHRKEVFDQRRANHLGNGSQDEFAGPGTPVKADIPAK